MITLPQMPQGVEHFSIANRKVGLMQYGGKPSDAVRRYITSYP